MQTARDDICRIRYLISNGVIANVTLFDRDLLLQGQTLNVNIYKTVKASAKLHEVTFIDLTFAIE